ncbi:MAG: epoxyqueuosine reductase QueH [Fusobacteriaceae bacterium]|nr:epoxyqueuosine reductase QueH [Fusobacteriaceae bacterium]
MKVDYEKKMQEILCLAKNDTSKKSLLLHSCCAPCSAAVLEFLKEYFDVTIFFYNPNITDGSEYIKREMEQEQYLTKNCLNIKFIKGNYDVQNDFYSVVAGYEKSPEGGERCSLCYEKRMLETAEFAKKENYDYFATVLSISPLKNSKKLNEIGEELEKKIGIKYLYADFKKKGRYQRGIEISKDNNLYRQDYCGCIFSKEESYNRKTKKIDNKEV